MLAWSGMYLRGQARRHVAGLGDLTDSEAAALGFSVNSPGPRHLKEAAEAEHVYGFVLGDGLARLMVLTCGCADTREGIWVSRLQEVTDAIGEYVGCEPGYQLVNTVIDELKPLPVRTGRGHPKQDGHV